MRLQFGVLPIPGWTDRKGLCQAESGASTPLGLTFPDRSVSNYGTDRRDEELLSVVPEGRTKMILRMLAAGISVEEIADAVGLSPEEIDVLVARARIRVLTASIRDRGAPPRR